MYEKIEPRRDIEHVVDIEDGTYLRVSNSQFVKIEYSHGYQVAYTNWYRPESQRQATTPLELQGAIYDIPVDGFFGVWTDDNDNSYIEQCYWVEDEFPATHLASTWAQHSIWDWSEQQELVI